MKFLRSKRLKEYTVEELELDIKTDTILSLLISGVGIAFFIIEMVYRASFHYPFCDDGFVLAVMAITFSIVLLCFIDSLISETEIRFRKIEEQIK